VSVKTLLGFDYGTRRIGVAVGQTLTGTATPLATVRVLNGRPDWSHINVLIRQWQPQALVVGLPLQMDGGTQQVTGKAEKFARQLRGRHRLPVYFADERLTTREARLRVSGNADLDCVAAQVILESWLNHDHKLAAPAVVCA
jgi:putative Holliday junction resolvase